MKEKNLKKALVISFLYFVFLFFGSSLSQKANPARWTIETIKGADKSTHSVYLKPLLPTVGMCDTASAVEVEATAGTLGPSGYATLKLAFDAINAGTHKGAINIEICANTTEGTTPATLNSSGAGSASYTSISIRPLNDNLSVSGNPATGFGVIQLNGADNVTIDGDNPNTAGTNRNLTIQNTVSNTTNYSSVVRIALSTNVSTANNDTVKNCIITGSATGRNISSAFATNGSQNTTYGILVGGGASSTVTTAPSAIGSVSTTVGGAITATNFTAANNQIDACARGIAVNGSATTVADGLTITNNIIGNAAAGNTTTVYSRALSLQGFNNAAISGNTIRNIESYLALITMGIVLGDVSNIGTNTVVESNSISNVFNRHTGTFGAYGINVNAGNSFTVRNNFVSGINHDMTAGFDFGTDFGVYGIRLATGNNHKIYHNSVNLFGTSPGTVNTKLLSACLSIISPLQTGIDVRNNIFANTLTSGTTETANVSVYLPDSGTSAMNLTINNNAYFTGSAAGRYGVAQVGSSYLSPPAGPSAYSGLYEAANFNAGTTTPSSNLRSYTNTLSAAGTNDNASFASTAAAPFASGANLHIPNGTITLLESGGANVGVTTDIDAEARNGATPDIGADEFNGVLPPANDIAAIAFINPANGGSVGVGVAFAPKATFTNNGSASQSAVQVRYKIIDSSSAEIYNQTAIISSISPGATVPVSFPNTTINSAGTCAIQAAVELAGDANTANDLISGSISALNPLSGNYNVGTAQTFSSMTNSGGLFEAINTLGLGGNVTISVTSDLTNETGSVALNQWVEAGAGNYTLTIQSDSTTLRTISGSAANGMIRLNGADRVRFDGRTGGAGKFLRFRNTNGSKPTFTFLNDATFNLIESCIVESNDSIGASGTIAFDTTNGTLGNSNNTINNCDLRDRSDVSQQPASAVYSNGTAGIPNANNTISNNNIFNWSYAAIRTDDQAEAWTISRNSFYITISNFSALDLWAIYLSGGSGHNIVNNSIGGTAPLAGGSNMSITCDFTGISLFGGTTAPTSIQGNVIKNIRSSYTGTLNSYGIEINTGQANIGNIAGNVIGSSNAAERFEINGSENTGIKVYSDAAINVSNNIINNMSGSAPTSPAGQWIYGIRVDGTGSHTIVNNTVTNLTNNSATMAFAGGETRTIGINILASGVQTIRGNTISNIGNSRTTAPTSNNHNVWGLYLYSTAAGTLVEKNSISNIYASSTAVGARADTIKGLLVDSGANATVRNNMISINGGGNSDRSVIGISDMSGSGSTVNYYFNSVSVYGTATNANNTYAFNRSATTTVSLRNNIFSNTRTGGSGFHAAMANTTTATGWTATASDYNDLFNVNNAHLTQWLGSASANNKTLATFRTSSGGDAHTLNADPSFNSAINLHIKRSAPEILAAVEDAGITFGGVTADFDGDSRSNPPDIGADEVNPAQLNATPVITYTALSHLPSAANPTLTLTIADNAGVETSAAFVPRIYYKKNAESYTSNVCAMTGGTTRNGTWNCVIDYSVGGFGSAANSDSITYFVIAQNTAGGISSSPGGVTAGDVNTITAYPTAPNLYAIGNGGIIPAGRYSYIGAGSTTLGGDVTVEGMIALDGIVTTGSANTLNIGANGSISGASSTSYVFGSLKKTFTTIFTRSDGNSFAPANTFIYPVGTANGISPVTINATAGGGNLGFTVSAVQNFLPGTNTSQSIQRYWTLTSDGITQADVTFQYLDADVPAGANESSFKFIRRSGATNMTFDPSSIDTAANTFTLNGVTQFSDWTLGAAAAVPTAASVAVSGRLVNADGYRVANATIKLVSQNGEMLTARTNPFGYYHFNNIAAGETYVISISHKQYQFAPRVIFIAEPLTNLDFTALSR